MTAAASTVLASASARQFRRRGTTLEPFDPGLASVLVTTGANSITRNPMYVGLAGLLLANAIRRASWTGLLPMVGFVVAIDRLQIAAEEAALRSRFGSDYEAYLVEVPRWLDRRSLRILSSGPASDSATMPL
jgi:protein-S-isoprenylcysteine O-methyltransferase Ste14